jgi:hypothetical protein
MILVGSIVEYARLENSEHLADFANAVRMSRLADDVSPENPFKAELVMLSRMYRVLVSGPGRNVLHVEGSQLLKVRLPLGLLVELTCTRSLQMLLEALSYRVSSKKVS